MSDTIEFAPIFVPHSDIVNDALSSLIQCMEEAFGGRIRAYYLHGSHADGTAVDTSDVDISIIFKGGFLSDTEAQRARDLVAKLPMQTHLDISIEEEAALLFQADPAFKLAGKFLYGEDIRDQLPLMSIESWTRDRMHSSYWRLVKLFHRPTPVQWPLNYPDSDDEFYGYVRRPVRLEDGSEITSTRDLMRAVGWMATALIALHAQRYVRRKADIYRIYQEEIGDRWGALIEETYRCCKVEWHYRIPHARGLLRALCSRLLPFENHFLAIYKEYLLQELTTDNEALLRHNLWLQEQIPWQDNEVNQATQAARQKLTPP